MSFPVAHPSAVTLCLLRLCVLVRLCHSSFHLSPISIPQPCEPVTQGGPLISYISIITAVAEAAGRCSFSSWFEVQSVMAGTLRWQDLEAAGHLVSTVRKPRAEKVAIRLTSSCLCSLRSQPVEWHNLHTVRVFLPQLT